MRLVTTRAEAERSPAVLKLLDFAQADGSTAEDYEESLTIPDLEIWVTSELAQHQVFPSRISLR